MGKDFEIPSWSIKTCSVCGVVKPINQFHCKARMKIVKHTSVCKECTRKQSAKSHEKYRKEHREKVNCRQRSFHLEKRKVLIRPPSCAICGCNSRLDRHHTSYKDAGAVVYVCKKCHAQIHKEMRYRSKVDNSAQFYFEFVKAM